MSELEKMTNEELAARLNFQASTKEALGGDAKVEREAARRLTQPVGEPGSLLDALRNARMTVAAWPDEQGYSPFSTDTERDAIVDALDHAITALSKPVGECMKCYEMTLLIAELDAVWSFDDSQRHTHNWHDKQDILEKLRALAKPPTE